MTRFSIRPLMLSLLLTFASLLPLQANAYTFVSATNSTTATKTGVVISAGQSLIIFAMDGNAGSETLTISDGTNTYVTRGTTTETFNGWTATLIDCLSPVPGTYTLTLSGATGGGPQFLILKYTGIASYSTGAWPGAHFGSSVPSSTDGATTSAITPTSYNALLVGLAANNGGANSYVLSSGTGFTSRFTQGVTGYPSFAEDMEVTSGSHIASFTAGATQTSLIVMGAAYNESGGSSCTNNFWSSTGAFAIPNGTTGSYWSTTGLFATPDCSTGSYWLKSGAVGAN